ncbi:MAG: MCE family protein [Cyclobacteriaceae bacterium]|nr:MCE family protein [Cyclobacteriaceae bacterium]
MTISKEVRVGLFMVVSLVLLYLGFNFLKGIDFFSSRTKYYAIYENVDQLMPSNQVYLSGVSVGRVSDVQIDQQRGRVVVELEIDSYVVLGDSSVAMLNSDFLGTKSIQLSIGNFKNRLEPKDTLLSTVAKGIATFLEESAAPVADNLQSTLRKLNTILDNLARNSQKLDGMFDEFGSTPGKINYTIDNANRALTGMSDSIKLVTKNVNSALRTINPTLENFRTLSDSLKSLEVNETLSKIKMTLAKLNETMDKFSKGDNTVSKLLTEDSLYVNLNKLFLSVDSLATHFNENPKHFMAPLGKSRKKIQRELEKQRTED